MNRRWTDAAIERAIEMHDSGMSWREAGAVGVLLNTRGLMELVILNIGLDIQVISPGLFSMMVVMALVTTLMTGPALDLITATRVPAEAGEGIGETLARQSAGASTREFRTNS